jgi:hypothetical protein
MTVIGFAYFNAILLNDVSTTALDDAVGRDYFKLVFVTFSECHFRNCRLAGTGLME